MNAVGYIYEVKVKILFTDAEILRLVEALREGKHPGFALCIRHLQRTEHQYPTSFTYQGLVELADALEPKAKRTAGRLREIATKLSREGIRLSRTSEPRKHRKAN